MFSLLSELLNFFSEIQVAASTNQVADQQMPVYNLPAKILCRVVNVLLKVSSSLFFHISFLFR